MPMPADVLFMAPGLGTGGTERHLAWLLPGLQAEGLAVEIWNTGEDGDAAHRLRQAGVRVVSREAPLSPRHVRRLAAWTAALARQRPALVHSYLYGHHWLDAMACRMAGVAYVGSRRNLAHWRQGPVLSRERWRDRSSVAIIANSVAAADVALAEGTEARLLHVIANGIPLPSWAQAAWSQDEAWRARRADARDSLGLAQDARVVGAVMSLKPVKDPVTLLLAFAGRRDLRPGDRLVMIGEGPLSEELEQRAHALGVGGQMILAGRRSEPMELLAAFDLFCLPSRSEGSSNALLEAMAAALPVVATSVGGSSEVVAPDETGYLVAPGDSAGMARLLDQLMSDTERCRRLGREARIRAEEHFSLETMVMAHKALYQQLMPRSSSHVA